VHDIFSPKSIAESSQAQNFLTAPRRTVLALGYRVLGNIHIYWTVLLLGYIFFIVTPNMLPIRQQSAPSTW